MIAGTGHADAAWSVDPSKFTHSASLADGVLTVTVTNTTALPAKCSLGVSKGSAAGASANFASLSNKWYSGEGTYDDLVAAAAPVMAAKLTDLEPDSPLPAGGKEVFTWKSGRSDTSYAVLQLCSAYDGAGNVVWGNSSYLVTGTGVGTSLPGTGSLGSLFP